MFTKASDTTSGEVSAEEKMKGIIEDLMDKLPEEFNMQELLGKVFKLFFYLTCLWMINNSGEFPLSKLIGKLLGKGIFHFLNIHCSIFYKTIQERKVFSKYVESRNLTAKIISRTLTCIQAITFYFMFYLILVLLEIKNILKTIDPKRHS